MTKRFDEDHVYGLEGEQLNRLDAVMQKLHGGSDRERDIGHQLWLILNEASPVFSLARDEREPGETRRVT